MADEKALQQNQSSVADLLERFRSAIVPEAVHKDYLAKQDLLKLDPASFIASLKQPLPSETLVSPMAGVMPMAGMAKVFKPGPQIAVLAKAGEVPITPIHKLWPAAINETTGEIAHAMQPGPFMHEPLLQSIKNSVRGWVDPITWKAFTDKMLAKAGF